MSQSTRVRFTCRHKTDPGQRLVLVGSSPLLGGWDPVRGLECSPGLNNDEWHCVVSLPVKKSYEYKYVIMKLQGDNSGIGSGELSVVRYESFDGNRTIKTEGQIMDVDDKRFDELDNSTKEPRIRISNTNVIKHPETQSLSSSNGPFGALENISTLLIVIYRLPITAAKDPQTKKWSFAWDDDALYLTSAGLRIGLEGKVKVTWVGIINTSDVIEDNEKEQVAKELLTGFNCVPVYLDSETKEKFYSGFCKSVLWPIFHMTNKLSTPERKTATFDYELWKVYCDVNRQFADVVLKVYAEGNLIWIHDYHLMVMPAQLRLKIPGAKIGFFLHIPWPSSESYRILPVRDEILRGLLSSTLLGFHLFDYARHFLSACIRLLNLEHEARRGSLGVEYAGRHVMLRVSHVGIDPKRFKDPDSKTENEVNEIVKTLGARSGTKMVLGAIDDLDFIKGITLKLIAFETILNNYPAYRNKVSLIQAALPKASRVESKLQKEIADLVQRINTSFGTSTYEPVTYIERDISMEERMAIYKLSDALMLTPIRDGLNLIPYEYILCAPDGKGQLILSEFTGCSKALSGAIRLNPWSIDEVLNAVDSVLQKTKQEVDLRHKADLKYVGNHSAAKWAESFLSDLERASEPIQKLTKLNLGFSDGARLLEFEGFQHLEMHTLLRAYDVSTRRLFLLDYDGVLIDTKLSKMSHVWARPSDVVMSYLDALSSDPKNTVYIMSGRINSVLDKAFETNRSLGLSAEHGFQYRPPNHNNWKMLKKEIDLSWLEIAYEIMHSYTERTDGSYVEEKSTGLVWHYSDADPEFGGWQAKECHDHLERVLCSYDVQVISGFGWIQVRAAGLNKGLMVQKILKDMIEDGGNDSAPPDFILCMGDDKTDEDMFTYLDSTMNGTATLFTCTVGVKPSNAHYYLRSVNEVGEVLGLLSANASHLGKVNKFNTIEDFRGIYEHMKNLDMNRAGQS